MLRRLERWFHQHLFKVGWLLTQNYKTTTILYYTFFLPGVLLYEVIYWLAAGMFNVRAEGSISLPEEQDVGELKLNFVKLAPRVGSYRKTFISTMPLFVGFFIIWLVADTLFDIRTVGDMMSSGTLEDVGMALHYLTNAPDFWLWFYLIFTIANTMFPNVPKDLQGWRTIVAGFLLLTSILLIVGVGDEILGSIAEPFGQINGTIQGVLFMLIGFNLLMTLALGLIEYTTEHITGRSATFKKGKMITMTRAEALALREQEREKERKRIEQQRKRLEAVQSAPKSIYDLHFPLPGAPGEEPITQLTIALEIEHDTGVSGDGRRKPDTIEGIFQRPLIPEKADGAEEVTHAVEEKPGVAFNFGRMSDTPKAEAEKKASPLVPEKTTSSEDDALEDEEEMFNLPALTPKFGGVAGTPKPSPFAPPKPSEDDDDDEDDDDEEIRAPLTSKFSGFTSAPKPSPFAPPKPSEDDDDDDDEEIRAPLASKFSGFTSAPKPSPFAPPKPSEDDDDDEDEEDEEDEEIRAPLASKFSGFTSAPKPSPFAPPKPSEDDDDDDDDEDDDDEEEIRAPLASKFSGFTSAPKPSPFAPPKPSEEDDDDDDDDEEIRAPLASKFSGFTSAPKPSPFAPPTPSEDDEEEYFDEEGEYVEDDDIDYVDDDFGYIDDDESEGFITDDD